METKSNPKYIIKRNYRVWYSINVLDTGHPKKLYKVLEGLSSANDAKKKLEEIIPGAKATKAWCLDK